MKRGELWTAAGGSDFLSKPRPVLIVHSDEHASVDSSTVCLLSSEVSEASVIRPQIEPSGENGLLVRSVVRGDTITTVSSTRLGRRIGRVSTNDMARVERAMIHFLGLNR